MSEGTTLRETRRAYLPEITRTMIPVIVTRQLCAVHGDGVGKAGLSLFPRLRRLHLFDGLLNLVKMSLRMERLNPSGAMVASEEHVPEKRARVTQPQRSTMLWRCS